MERIIAENLVWDDGYVNLHVMKRYSLLSFGVVLTAEADDRPHIN